MYRGQKIKKMLVFSIVQLLLTNSFMTIVGSETTINEKEDIYLEEEIPLDISYVYNITENLSNIIFTEYNESAGEIAKGRAYGTKGEHKAAEILYENFTKLGLFTYNETIENTEKYPELTHELEIEEFFVKFNGEKIESYIAPVWFETSENNNCLNYTYNYTNLKVIQAKINPFLYILKEKINGTLEPFIIIMKDNSFHPYECFENKTIFDNFYFSYFFLRYTQGSNPILYSYLWNNYLDYFKGLILYDYNKDVYDMNILKYKNKVPFIYINNSNGNKILNNLDNSKIDFKIRQNLNTSVNSKNVIAQLNGTDPSKTVLVDCLYDLWWCQGTADSAIGMAMVLAIAKYYVENNIRPKYTIKFIGFCGEEHGFCAGSKYYSSIHEDENILYIIDLNQLGFKQLNPKLILNIFGNDIALLLKIKHVLKDANYVERVNSSKDLDYIYLKRKIPSNPLPFLESHPKSKILCFLKDGNWKLHHRDGMNHQEGDVLKYFDPQDVNVTGELILKTLRYLTVE